MNTYDLEKRELLARYADVLQRSSLPSVEELHAKVVSQHVSELNRQAIALLLLERYASVCGLGHTVWGAFLFETSELEQLDAYANSIRNAERLAAGILGELRDAGFDLDTYPDLPV